jgi:hypothetical protein
MLYGWIEVGLSNNTLFSNEVDQDIILRTIYSNKIILGNTDGTAANAAIYILGNNVGLKKVPQSNVALDVDGAAVLKSLQVGISNLPTQLALNGDLIIKDKAQNFGNAMQLMVTNNNAAIDYMYNGVNRVKMTDGQGITLNDNVFVTNDVYANAYHLTSDLRFKQNISPTIPKRDMKTLQKLQVKDYELIVNPGNRVKGFIAQEVEEVFPQAITDCGDKKTIDINQITALNTSVLQSVLKRLDELECEVYRLTNQVT